MIGLPLESRVGTNVSPRMPLASRLTCVEQVAECWGTSGWVLRAAHERLCT